MARTKVDTLAVNGRNAKGQFAKGQWAGGPGRPARKTEFQYLRLLSEACSLEDWRSIILKAISQAKEGDFRARAWLAVYLLGPPPEACAPKLSEIEDAEFIDQLIHDDLEFDADEQDLLNG